MNLNFQKMYDISMPISTTMPVYKGKEEKRPKLTVESDFTTGKAYESRLEMNLHTGTHLDRPLHMLPGGNTMDTLEIDQLLTECKVIDLLEVKEKITKQDLIGKNIIEGDFILLKTKNSYEDILEKDFIYVEKSGAEYLAEQRIKGIGIDSLGIECNQPEHETHLSLMNAGVHILEGLMLKDIKEGRYFLIALPLHILGTEAAPVRAVLLQ